MVAHALTAAAALDQKDVRVVYALIPEHIREVLCKDLEYVASSS